MIDKRVQLDLFYDYRTNVDLYPRWQMFLRQKQPKILFFWGQNDILFTRAGGEAFLRDLPDAEMHRLDSGHFAIVDSSTRSLPTFGVSMMRRWLLTRRTQAGNPPDGRKFAPARG